MVELTVNGKSGRFFVDTGGGELILDHNFASSVALQEQTGQPGTFAGAKRANLNYGLADQLKLGSIMIHDVPVVVMDLKGVNSLFHPGIQGCLGTTVLSQFLSSIDYPNHRLVLRSRDASPLTVPLAKLPFWLAGDHYMVTWGQLNDAPPSLLFVDTGLAGGGYTGARKDIEAAGINLGDDKGLKGMGAAGQVSVIPFVVDRLKLGTLERKSIRGLFLGSFPLEDRFGFHIGGIISQDFFRPYVITFDFKRMMIYLDGKGV